MEQKQAVLKFGGTSAASPERCADIFLGDSEYNRVAVMSAIGRNYMTTDSEPKVTDALIALEAAVDRGGKKGESLATEAREYVIDRVIGTYSSLGRAVLNKATDDMAEHLKSENRRDGFAWLGEHMSARLFSELTGATYVSTDLQFAGGFLQVKKSLDMITRHIFPVLSAGKQVITEGFYGYDFRTGRIEVLPRGGSDTSGVVYTGALNTVQPGEWINKNYTDKDGILSADPDLVPNARVIPEITHEEVREKMHGITERNGVIHGDAIAYASQLGVEIIVKNTFNAEEPGTHIVNSRTSNPEQPIIGISGKSDVVTIDAFDMGMADAKNYLSPILALAGELDASVSNIPTGEDRIKLVFNSGVSDEQLNALKNYILKNAISGEKATASISKDEGAIYLVGQELTNPLTYTKTIGRVATILADGQLPMREVISHEKSPSLALTVAGSHVDTIIRLLHRELVED